MIAEWSISLSKDLDMVVYDLVSSSELLLSPARNGLLRPGVSVEASVIDVDG
jgi:hypothetical protein